MKIGYFRNWNLRKKIELEILKSGLSDDLLRGYRDIYLNPFTSGFQLFYPQKAPGLNTFPTVLLMCFATQFLLPRNKALDQNWNSTKEMLLLFWDGQPKTERKKTA